MKLNKDINSFPYAEITRGGLESDIINIDDWLENLEHIGSSGIIESINITNQYNTTKVTRPPSDSNSEFLNRISHLRCRITHVETNVIIPGLSPILKTVKIEGSL